MDYVCSRCRERHDGLPFASHDPAPALWTPDLADEPTSELDDELCEPTDHPLAVEQREGIPLARVIEIAEHVLHGADPPR